MKTRKEIRDKLLMSIGRGQWRDFYYEKLKKYCESKVGSINSHRTITRLYP